MSKNYSFEHDIKEALAMAEALGEYVRGQRLYGVVRGGRFSGASSLTAGALLMRLRRLHHLRESLKDFQVKNLDKALDYYEAVRDEWTLHYQGKLQQEAHSRLDAMRTFFYECGDNIQNCIGIYKPEILRRTIVQEILFELEALEVQDSELDIKVKGTDSRLRHYVEPANFQWSEEIQPAYDEDDFWWLYHCPPKL
ncbi:MAG: hypothetical protein Q9P44_17855 [Anaerolineae bacterium]|nr:hypothetical protein [Anaerolineae bacterium]